MAEEISKIVLNTAKNWWLTGAGARTMSDVEKEEDEDEFVLMGDGSGGMKKVFLPPSSRVVEMYKNSNWQLN
jgi:hypothetical protein